MSTLKANNLDTESGTTITVAVGKTLAGTDIIGATQIADDAVTPAKINIFDDALAATTTHFLIADGTDYSSFALSGDITSTNAGAVTIADNAVSLSKMAGLARGSIIYGDASGDPAALAKGTADQVLKSDGTDIAWGADSGGLYESWALITDEKAQNTYGQSITGGAWRTREVQTEVYDPDGIVSIASDQFTIGPGTFLIIAHPLEQGGNAAQYRIYDDTNSAQVQLGLSYYGNNGTNDGTRDANIFGRVVIPSGTVTYEVQVYNASGTTSSTNPSNVPSTTEHYMFVEIYKYA